MGFVIGPIAQAEIKGIKSMPAALTQLATMLNDPNAGAEDFARVLELDPVMTADVLRMANSAWSRSNTEILTVRDAIMRIGAANVLKMGVGTRVKSSMKEAASGYDLPVGELWRHSVAVPDPSTINFLPSSRPTVSRFTMAIASVAGHVRIART